MSDITKCNGDNCILKKKCKRYLDIEQNGYPQSFFMTIPFKENKENKIFECEYFWNVITAKHSVKIRVCDDKINENSIIEDYKKDTKIKMSKKDILESLEFKEWYYLFSKHCL